MSRVMLTEKCPKGVPTVRVQGGDTSGWQKCGPSGVRWSSEGHKERRIGRARRHDWLCSSLSALHLELVAEMATKPVGGLTRAESEQSDLVLLQIRGAS